MKPPVRFAWRRGLCKGQMGGSPLWQRIQYMRKYLAAKQTSKVRSSGDRRSTELGAGGDGNSGRAGPPKTAGREQSTLSSGGEGAAADDNESS